MKILVVKLSSLGDILHALPAVHAIRAATGADVDWAVHPEFSALVRTFRDVRRVIEVPRHHLPRGLAASLRALRGERYDIAIDLQGLAKSAAVMLAVRAVR
ncbi:MAG: glycosyltransferase family 9 protein, partial [Kiritimatiellae bacterium]|nr:glycosyltransferase family 9 protein [Kiritimatiellia bacterium]